jgi:hypothetical protein
MERWLELRDELSLTQDQVTRLETIREELRSENAAHLRRIREVREELGLPDVHFGERDPRAEGERGEAERPRERMSGEDREAMRAFMDRIRGDMDAIRHNTRDAMEQARDVLTEEQRELARERMRAEMRERRGERGKRDRGERRPRGERRERAEGGESRT